MRKDLFSEDFLRRLELLSIHLKSQMEGGLTGIRKSMSKGTSVEFSDFREYTPGDDFRRIDWNAYARFGKLYLKLFMEEKEALFHVLIDGSSSMGMDGKGDRTLQMAAALGYLAQKGQDRFRYLFFSGDGVGDSGVLSGGRGFNKGLDFLSRMEFSGTSNLKEMKKHMKPAKGGTFLLSDFFWDDSSDRATADLLETTLNFLGYCRQETAFLQVLSKNDWDPTWDGGVRFIDAETEEKLDLVLNPIRLKQYEKELEHFIDEIKDAGQKHGAAHVIIHVEEPFEKVFVNSLKGVHLI